MALTRGLPRRGLRGIYITLGFDFCHGVCMVGMLPDGWEAVVVAVAVDVERVLEQRAGAAGVSVGEFVDMLLRSQLWLLEDVGF